MNRIQIPVASLITKEQTWQAISVSQGVADMSFGHAQLVDETTDERWVCREGSPPWPIDVPYGHKVGASFLCSNTGDVTVKVFVYIELIDPDGIARAYATNPHGSIPQTVNPGVGYYSEYIGGVPLDKVGLWLIYGRLDYNIA
jgi:hypothetical protein